MSRTTCALLAGVFVLGCAHYAPMMDDDPGKEGYFLIGGRMYHEPYREVFETLKTRLRDKGYSLIRADLNSGVVSTASRPLEGSANRHCRCQRLASFDHLGRKVEMTFVVTELSPARTQITVRSRFTAYWSDGRGTIERTCASDGKIEKDILRF